MRQSSVANAASESARSATDSIAAQLRGQGVEVLTCHGCCGWDFRILPRLTRIVRSVQPDIVHSLLFHANVAARFAVHEAGLPRKALVCEIQTVEVERRWHLWVDQWTQRGCRLTIGNSPSVIEHLHRSARIPMDRLLLIRGGVAPGRFRSASPASHESLGVPTDAPIVLWVGRLDPVKGLDVLIDAFETVARESAARKSAAHLLLVGGGPMERKLEEQIARADLGSCVHLLGPRRDVPALLRAADVFVLPSRTEGLPNALLEAMVAGCPIVTTDVPGCRDLIENEKTGLRVPFGDATGLARAMLRLLNDRDFATRLGAAAQDSAERTWHIDRTMDGYADLYEKMMCS